MLPENLEASDPKESGRFGPKRHEKASSDKAMKTQELDGYDAPHKAFVDDRVMQAFLLDQFSTTLQPTAGVTNERGE